METGLQLLLHDGAVQITFKPRLTAEQYAELTGLVEASATKSDFRRAIEAAALRWDRELAFDETSL